MRTWRPHAVIARSILRLRHGPSARSIVVLASLALALVSFPGPATAQADQPWQGFVHGQLGAASNPTAVGAMAIG
ncbi:hypothetical protein, partial [Tritonibacter sp. SIMBA_163]|uniref:hypothetical protein n=1 Tax=Tritonibacter sp. SIMBA_163 TaxID=3080868 RepID=UPI00398079FA